jgi:hypothetical protein
MGALTVEREIRQQSAGLASAKSGDRPAILFRSQGSQKLDLTRSNQWESLVIGTRVNHKTLRTPITRGKRSDCNMVLPGHIRDSRFVPSFPPCSE